VVAEQRKLQFGFNQGGPTMLVLSRKCGERIVINEDITVEVIAVKGNKVRLGIVAPKEVSVHRQEVLERDRARHDREREQQSAMAGGQASGSNHGALVEFTSWASPTVATTPER
jgi:carbon storage regulator